MQTNLELRADFSRAFQDLPWLERRNTELFEANSIQYNEIEQLKLYKQKYDELLQQVHTYGLSAKRPEYYQQRSEQVQRQLEISDNLLGKSQKYVKALEEKLQTLSQSEKLDKEKLWLRAQLKKNARSTAYWARHRSTLDSKPAWGVRCACTESELAYGLKDQSPRILELEATVAARDLTITSLLASRAVGNVRNNGPASMSKPAKTSFPPTEDSKCAITESQTATTDFVHVCEHEEKCKNLDRHVAEDAKIIEQLRKECQDLKDAASNDTTAEDAKTIAQLRKECQELKDAASNNATADAAIINADAKAEGELAAKDTVIENLREELATKDEAIDDLRKEIATASEELATSSQVIEDLREEKVTTGEELAAKNEEINKLRGEKTTADRNATTKISDLSQELSDSRKTLSDVRQLHAECERDLGQQKIRVGELETAQCQMEDAIKQKDREIDDLEQANQELAEQPAPDSAENLRRITTANSDLDELRREHAECKGQSETQTARISELEAAADGFVATIKTKDDRIAAMEEQISNSLSRDSIESERQSHDDAIRKKDENYEALFKIYQKALKQKKDADDKHNEDMQSLNTMQQIVNARDLDLQRLWTEFNRLGANHTECEGRIAHYTDRLRQGGNTYTDLQNKYNTQATELDESKKDVSALRSEVAKLQQANANLEQMKSSSESTFEKYRVEGEERARPIWQATLDREMSAQALKLEESELRAFKLENQLQKARNQASPLREEQIKKREDAVKTKEETLKIGADGMANSEVKALEVKLAAANKEAGDARTRNRGIQNQLTKERKERMDEKERHEKQLKKEREESERGKEILKLRLEKDNPLKTTVSNLQNQVARLSKELEERK